MVQPKGTISAQVLAMLVEVREKVGILTERVENQGDSLGDRIIAQGKVIDERFESQTAQLDTQLKQMTISATKDAVVVAERLVEDRRRLEGLSEDVRQVKNEMAQLTAKISSNNSSVKLEALDGRVKVLEDLKLKGEGAKATLSVLWAVGGVVFTTVLLAVLKFVFK